MTTKPLSLRDEFAGKAMQALINNEGLLKKTWWNENGSEIKTERQLAKVAYIFADAMLEARDQE